MFFAIIIRVIILFCAVNYAHQSNLKYQVVKAISGADSSNSSYDFYLLSNGVAKILNANDTSFFTSDNWDSIQTVDSRIIASFIRDQDVPSCQVNEKNGPDEKRLIYDLKVICEKCKNPAIVRFNSRLLLCGEFQSHGTQLIFSWINNTRFPFFSNDDYLGIKTKVHKLGIELYGIDPRILEISDDKFLVVYSLFGKHVGKGCIVVAGYEKNQSSGTMEFYLPPKKVFLDTDRNSRQKNWMPFLFNNTAHFVQRINPLQIVTLSHQDSNGDCIATTVSTQGTVHLTWEHGELRGGSNIVLLRQRKEYLGLFHSIGGFAYEAKKTYFMGAFTFSAEPPFQLLSVSHQPILDKDNALYDGRWFKVMGLPYNFVNYPTGLVVEEAQGVVHVSLGHNDDTGYLAKINLQELLDSMQPV